MSEDRFLAAHPELAEADRTSPRWIRAVTALMAPWAAWFRVRSEGWQHVPSGPCLLVANHSVGAAFEIPLLLREWRRAMGDRVARGLLHRIAWHVPFKLFPLFPKLGGVYAHPKAARRALDKGAALLVFPGGDVEAMRPWSDRYKIVFAGRTGYVRLARDAGVPIVPITICGSHAAFVMLPGAQAYAKLWRLDRLFRIKRFPLTGGYALSTAMLIATIVHPALWPWYLAATAYAFVPFPTKIEINVLPALRAADGETDAQAAARVEGAMQAAMDGMAARRHTPLG